MWEADWRREGGRPHNCNFLSSRWEARAWTPWAEVVEGRGEWTGFDDLSPAPTYRQRRRTLRTQVNLPDERNWDQERKTKIRRTCGPLSWIDAFWLAIGQVHVGFRTKYARGTDWERSLRAGMEEQVCRLGVRAPPTLQEGCGVAVHAALFFNGWATAGLKIMLRILVLVTGRW